MLTCPAVLDFSFLSESRSLSMGAAIALVSLHISLGTPGPLLLSVSIRLFGGLLRLNNKFMICLFLDLNFRWIMKLLKVIRTQQYIKLNTGAKESNR